MCIRDSVRMSSTPRSKARSLVLRSPRRVSPRTGVPLRLSVLEAPSSLSTAVASSWSMSTTEMLGAHASRIASASARLLAARTAKTPWFRVRVIRSTTRGRSWSTSARLASMIGAFTWPVVTLILAARRRSIQRRHVVGDGRPAERSCRESPTIAFSRARTGETFRPVHPREVPRLSPLAARRSARPMETSTRRGAARPMLDIGRLEPTRVPLARNVKVHIHVRAPTLRFCTATRSCMGAIQPVTSQLARLLPGANAGTLRRLEHAAQEKTFRRRDMLHARGSQLPPFVVLDGHVMTRRVAETGQVRAALIAEPGYLGGLRSISDPDGDAFYELIALTDGTWATWDPGLLRRLALEDAGLAVDLLDLSADRMAVLNMRLDERSFETARQRMAAILSR